MPSMKKHLFDETHMLYLLPGNFKIRVANPHRINVTMMYCVIIIDIVSSYLSLKGATYPTHVLNLFNGCGVVWGKKPLYNNYRKIYTGPTVLSGALFQKSTL